MAETFHELIARNKRNSWLLIFLFTLVFVALGLLIGNFWGQYWGGHQQEFSINPHTGRPVAAGPTDAELRASQLRWSLTVAAGAAVLAFLISLATYYGGDSVLLSISKAREITHDDDPQLFNVVEELTIAGGLPMPRVYIIDDSAMNAFSAGRDPRHASVAITSGLRQKLTRDELQGVIGHELSHVRHYDILFATLIAVMVGVIVMLADVFMRSLWFSGGSRRQSRDREGGNGVIQIVLLVLAVVFAILAPLLARIIQMAISRQREYLADAGSVQLTRNPKGLASALAKLGGDEEVLEVANRATSALYIVHPIKKFEERSASIFDTHPPISDRINRLLSMGA